MKNKVDFVNDVLGRLGSEHGAGSFEYLRERIEKAYDTEGEISDSDLDELISGGDDGEVDPEVQKKYPLLNEVALAPILGFEDDNDVDEPSDFEDEDEEDDEDSDEEDEEDDDE